MVCDADTVGADMVPGCVVLVVEVDGVGGREASGDIGYTVEGLAVGDAVD